MVAASSLVLTVIFSLLCLIFMTLLLRLLGASDETIGYARQYLIFVVVIGGVPNVIISYIIYARVMRQIIPAGE